MKAARLYGVLAILLIAAPAMAEDLPGGWVTGTMTPRVKGHAPDPSLITAPVSVSQLDCGSFNGNACITGASLVNFTVPNGGGVATELPVTQGFLRHFAGPDANCTTLAHRAAVEVASSRNRDVRVDFGYRNGIQRRLYSNPANCNGDNLDVIFEDGSGPANVCNPAAGATISPVQSLSALDGVLLAGNSYTMTVRDTVAPGGTTRFLLGGFEADLSCPGATFPSVCPGVAASVAGTAAFAESALDGVTQPHLSLGALSACLHDGLFAVAIYYEISGTDKGEGTMVPLTSQLTAAYFKNASNLEAFIKVLNGCPINGFYWVFIGGLTDIRTIVTVTHMPSGFTRYYINPSGQAFLPVQDTGAFPICNGVL